VFNNRKIMFKLIRAIILYAAVSVLLLHNLTPHQHHGELAAALHEKEHNSKNALDYLRTVFHESATHIEHAKYKQVDVVKQVKKNVYQIPKKDNHDYFLGQSWRRQWQMMYEADLYYAELKELCLWLDCRSCWAELKREQINIYFSIVGFRAPPVLV
jgi:hypothetical protein